MEWKHSIAVLNKYGETLTDKWKENLRLKDKYANGDLYDSIDYNVEETNTKFILTALYAEHGDYVIKGRYPYGVGKRDPAGVWKERKPPKDFIIQWCSIKGIPKSRAFAIQNNIAIWGILPYNFLKVPNSLKENFEKEFEEAYSLDIQEFILNGI